MKGSHLTRILSTLIIMGIISCGLLVYMGYNKARNAEESFCGVEELYSTYGAPIDEATDLWDKLLGILTDQLGETSEIITEIQRNTSDDTVATYIVETYYLPDSYNDDEAISIAIGRRILVHKILSAYNEEEIAAIAEGLLLNQP